MGSPYIYQCGHAANARIGQWDYVPSNSSFIARELKAAGWRTAHYGKWHLGCTPDAPSVDSYGFDDSVTYVSNRKNSKQWANASDPLQPFDDPWFPANSSRLIVDHTLAFAASAAQANAPFYVNVWYAQPHARLVRGAASTSEHALASTRERGLRLLRAARQTTDKEVGLTVMAGRVRARANDLQTCSQLVVWFQVAHLARPAQPHPGAAGELQCH